MSVVDLADLVLARLAKPSLDVLDGQVLITPPGAYVVLYDDAARLRPSTSAAAYRRQTWTFRVVCSGRDAAETRDVAAWVLDQLTGWRPQPDDRSSGMVTPVPEGAPILRDDSVPGDVRFSQTLVFQHASTRS